MAKAIHSMIRVFDLDQSLSFYQQALDLNIAERLDFDDFTLVYLRNDENDFEIELTHNHNQTEPYTHGSGYGHLAVCVDDAVASQQQLTELGYQPAEVKEFHRDNQLFARFFFVTDPDGYKIEFLEKHGRYQ
ncbi:VOC family protein [Amphritea sp. 1_MG-2023]|uniref:VOC family protein n=1 Tax=Amphritea sp. 1_MG-2023 TaxID=3062670 RepID=UPI0026E27253|nr:VOC family protein [Amphritea sp. 1_MG-2023]MDO6561908.1 VOC family protein [Amphritea sp. 1_MG-2023]